MGTIRDNRGYNQIWAESKATHIRAERRCDYMIEHIDRTEARNILEIGCGTGDNAHMVAAKTGHTVLGTDLSESFIKQASVRWQSSNLRYEVLDFNRERDLPSTEFDYIIGNGILHHLFHSLDEALRNIKRLLKPGGSILFYEPNIYNPYCALIFTVPFLRAKARLEPTEMAFSRRFIQRKLFRAGFKDICVSYKDFLIPGVADVLINPLIVLGNIAERIPILKMSAQSLFIKARK